MPIGLIDAPEFASTKLTLQEGERLMLYSDGITECPGTTEDHMLDEDGLSTLVRPLMSKRGPKFVDALVEGLGSFAGSTEFPDDLSAVLIERLTKDDAAKTTDRHHSQPIPSPQVG